MVLVKKRKIKCKQNQIVTYLKERKIDFFLTIFTLFFVFKEKAMKEIKHIILKSVFGTLNTSEQKDLDLWLTDEDHQRLYERIRERLQQRDTVRFLAEIDTERALRIFHRRRRHHSLRVVAAAAGIAAAICLIIYLWPANQPTIVPNRQQIAQQHATITLSSGEVIDLTLHSTTHYANSDVIEIKNKGIHVKDNHSSESVGYNTLNVPHGDTYSIELPDGTKVWVNALSTLKFPSSFKNKNERIVELTGEAYFEVAHDASHPFLVKTRQQLITVKGTAFNVSAYDGEISRTTLCRGSVTVKTAKEQQINLNPGQQLALNSSGDFKIETVNTELYTTWIDGIYCFENQTLKDVFKVLSRWYDIQNVVFDLKSEETQLFSGKLRRSDDLRTILLVIEKGSKQSIEYKDKTVIIK